MKKQLHLLKENDDKKAFAVIEALSRENPDRIEVVLLQEARNTIPAWKSKTYLLRSKDEQSQTGASELVVIGYDQLVDLIFEADTVVAW
ncbi:MAG TPA: hypothetical protein VN944_04705 [Nitrospiria bacterium]|nr:hypothetical protein [Nitrospiria bacterium]